MLLDNEIICWNCHAKSTPGPCRTCGASLPPKINVIRLISIEAEFGSKAALEAAAHIAHFTLKRMELGYIPKHRDVLHRLCKAANIEPWEILTNGNAFMEAAGDLLSTRRPRLQVVKDRQ